jgi:hypothetical protein
MAASKSDGDVQYVTVAELSRRSRLSVATLHRLKDAGKIPFYQPGGKGSRLLFPADAIERAADAAQREQPTAANENESQHLNGPCPAWMSSRNQTT